MVKRSWCLVSASCRNILFKQLTLLWQLASRSNIMRSADHILEICNQGVTELSPIHPDVKLAFSEKRIREI
jgi:hypothetical protein